MWEICSLPWVSAICLQLCSFSFGAPLWFIRDSASVCYLKQEQLWKDKSSSSKSVHLSSTLFIFCLWHKLSLYQQSIHKIWETVFNIITWAFFLFECVNYVVVKIQHTAYVVRLVQRARAFSRVRGWPVEKWVMALTLNTYPVAALHCGLLCPKLVEKLLFPLLWWISHCMFVDLCWV